MNAESVATDIKVKQRIDLVKKIFGFVIPCAKEHYRMKQLLNTTDMTTVEKYVREILKYTSDKADYKSDVIETPEIKPWTLYIKDYYLAIQPNVVPLDVLVAIDDGFNTARINENNNRDKLEQLAKDVNSVIASSAKTQLALMSKTSEYNNLITDPGFENSTLTELDVGQTGTGKLEITNTEVHSGTQSLVLTDAKNATLIIPFDVKEGKKYLVSFWYKTNVSTAMYYLDLIPKTAKSVLNDYYRTIDYTNNEWKEVGFIYTAPAKAVTTEMWLVATRQHSLAKFWVDDILVYPIPNTVTISGKVTISGSTTPVANARVEVFNNQTASIGYLTTDSDGKYCFTVIPGTYSVTVCSDGYYSKTESNKIVSDSNITVNMSLSELPVPPHPLFNEHKFSIPDRVGEIQVVGGHSEGSKGAVNPDKGEVAVIGFKGSQSGSYTLRVFDISGEMVYTETKAFVGAEDWFEWLPSGVSPGVYVVHVKGPGISARKKVVIVR